MDDIPEDPGPDESPEHLYMDLSTTQELIRQMNEYLASITQLPIEANGGGETSKTNIWQSSSESPLSERPRRKHTYLAKEDKSDGEEARRERNNHAISSIDENGGKDEIAWDFEDDSVVAMAKRMDDSSISTLPTLPPLKKKSASKLRKLKLAKTSGGNNRIEVVPPAPPRNADDSRHRSPPMQPAKQITERSPASAPTSVEFKSASNRERSIPSRNSPCSTVSSKDYVVKKDGYRRGSFDSANACGHRLGGAIDSKRATDESVAAIGSQVSAPRGRKSAKSAPTSCHESTKDRCDTGSKLGKPMQRDNDAAPKGRKSSLIFESASQELSAGHKIIAKSGISSTPRLVTRRHSNDSKTKSDHEPKTVRSLPQSQFTKFSQMPSQEIDEQRGMRIHDKVQARKSSGNSRGQPRGKHSQNICDSSEYDEDSDAQTQFFYESTDDEEELEGVGTSVADAVKNLNERRALAKVKNLVGILF
ncbi:hypothetical protein ACHAXA_001874 [Cyclostephanos tholiformis]|uniref:Uncharacterized protein n=1 Tax=Cyclostephanos tholiformis TaxID=382380 RepID=A0ABD3RBX8_9STRA